MNAPSLLLGFTLSVALLAAQAFGAPGDLDLGYNPTVTGAIRAAVLQPDGRIVIGGTFSHVSGVLRKGLARINPDGTLDAAFAPNPGAYFDTMAVNGLALQADGTILAAITNEPPGQGAYRGILRFNSDGTGAPFAYPNGDRVDSMAVQADGKIVIGRAFKDPIRLNEDGTVDATFSTTIVQPESNLTSAGILALTDDGEVLVGGRLKDGGESRGYLKRLNAQGGVEATLLDFSGGFGSTVYGATPQADRKILATAEGIGGGRSLLRISENGGLDSAFQPNANDFTALAALQADGKMMIHGAFSTVDGVARNRFARLHPDGTLDAGFANVGMGVNVVLQADGRAVIFGWFSSVLGTPRGSMARLDNDNATQSLTVPDSSRIQWLRGGTSPETNQVTFELSSDRGASWNSLGGATRIAGGWERTGLNLPAQYQIRARARVEGGLIETLLASPDVTFVPTLLSPASDDRNNGTISFSLPEAAFPGSVTLTFDDSIQPRVLTLAASEESAGGHSFTFTPSDPLASPHVALGEPIPAGVYTVVLSYQDAAGNPVATATATNVTVDDTPPTIGGMFSPLTIATGVDGQAVLPSYTAQAIVSDVGEVTVSQEPAPGSKHDVGMVSVTLTAKDVAGNTASASFDVQVDDGTPPTIDGTFTDLIIGTGVEGAATLPDYTTQVSPLDNVGVTEFTQSPAPESLAGVGVTHVVLTALDAAGNTAQREFDVTVFDGTPPTIGGSFAPLAIEVGPNGMAALPSYTAQAETSDNVEVTHVTQSPAAGTSQPVGTTQVTVTAKDAAGNEASTSFNVMVSASSAPAVGPPAEGFAPLVLSAPQGGTVALPSYSAQALSDDANATITQDPPVAERVGEGIVTVTLTATDSAGNQGTYSFEVTVLVSGLAVLAQSGAEVPNEAGDTRIPDGATWGTFGVPSISMEGTIAGWMATVKTAPRGSFQGIFNGPLDVPALVLRTGEEATNATGTAVAGVTFKSFREPAFSCEEFAVLATVKGTGVRPANDTGIWFGEGGTLVEAAREGTLAPGANARFAAFTSLAVPAPGVLFFVAKLAAPVPKDMGLWLWTPIGGAQMILREGDLVDVAGTEVRLKAFKTLTTVRGSAGHGRYDADAAVLDVWLLLADGRTALAGVAPDGSLGFYGVSGGVDANAHTVAGFGLSSSAGGGAVQVTSLATLALAPADGITAANNTGVFDHAANEFVAQRGMQAPGAVPATAKFKAFLDPVAGTNGLGLPVLAFGATLASAAVAADSGLWTYDGTLKLLARESAEPPGAVGTKWKAFTSLSVLEGRGPMFTATLASGAAKVKPGNDAGLWATDSAGELQLILREGAEIAPGKTLKSFDVLEAVAGSPGQRRAWTSGDASARVIYRAFFTDGTSAVVSTAVP